MRVLVTGGAGFLGTLLARELSRHKHILGQPLTDLVLTDLAPAAADLASSRNVQVRVGPLLEQCSSLAKEHFDLVFHLAGAVSAECEADFDLGMRSNLDSTRALLEALRAAGNRPRLVFASSVAVFGSDPGLPLPHTIADDTLPTPQSSYGTQKFICEQLVAEYTRKGFLDGRCGRLMTVAVRSGRPNRAASGFLSGIIREPLNGIDAICPVPPETAVALASPSNTIRSLIRLAEADRESLGGRTAINFPALTVTVREMLDALEEVGGTAARARVHFELDPVVARIVGGWPAAFAGDRAQRLGLQPDPDFRAIVREFVNETAGARTEA